MLDQKDEKLNKILSFECFIFDMDGTLIDLEELNFSAFQKTLKNKLDTNLEFDDYLKFFAGTRTQDSFDKYFKSKKLNIENYQEYINEFRKIKEFYLVNKIRQHSKEIEGASKFLKELKEKKKKLCLATSAIKKFAEIILKEYKIYDLFDIVITAEDVNKGKPDPEIYNLALKKMNVAANNAVVFEDAISGIESGKAAGIFVVGIRTKGRNDKEVEKANLVIDNYK